jgi:hypothetical protein
MRHEADRGTLSEEAVSVAFGAGKRELAEFAVHLLADMLEELRADYFALDFAP